jgi:hypothetical protein
MSEQRIICKFTHVLSLYLDGNEFHVTGAGVSDWFRLGDPAEGPLDGAVFLDEGLVHIIQGRSLYEVRFDPDTTFVVQRLRA